MRVSLFLFKLSLILILAWVFIWPLVFSELQFPLILRIGALGTLVLLFISIASLVILKQRSRQT